MFELAVRVCVYYIRPSSLQYWLFTLSIGRSDQEAKFAKSGFVPSKDSHLVKAAICYCPVQTNGTDAPRVSPNPSLPAWCNSSACRYYYSCCHCGRSRNRDLEQHKISSTSTKAGRGCRAAIALLRVVVFAVVGSRLRGDIEAAFPPLGLLALCMRTRLHEWCGHMGAQTPHSVRPCTIGASAYKYRFDWRFLPPCYIEALALGSGCYHQDVGGETGVKKPKKLATFASDAHSIYVERRRSRNKGASASAGGCIHIYIAAMRIRSSAEKIAREK